MVVAYVDVRLKRSEFAEQKALFEWSNFIPELRWMFAIPNGGKRDDRVGAMMKYQGVKAGVWDIFLPLPRGGYHGLFIEMKVGKNKLSNLQQEFMNFAKKNMYECKVCYSCKEAIKKILSYLNNKS